MRNCTEMFDGFPRRTADEADLRTDFRKFAAAFQASLKRCCTDLCANICSIYPVFPASLIRLIQNIQPLIQCLYRECWASVPSFWPTFAEHLKWSNNKPMRTLKDKSPLMLLNEKGIG